MSGTGTRHLDATGPREVVFCHQCANEWYRDEHGLTCPRCAGEIIEIVTADSDPRPLRDDSPPPDFRSLHGHYPFADDIPDPEEADIEEHVTHGPGGSIMFSRTITSSNAGGPGRRRNPLEDHPDPIMRDFQNMVGNMVGPGFRAGPPGRSGPDTLFNQGPFVGGFQLGGNGGPRAWGSRMTFTTGGGHRPRDANGPQPAGPPVDDLTTYASPPRVSPNGRSLYIVSIRAPPDQLPRILSGIFGPLGAPGGQNDRGPGGMPPGLQALFASMLNPANARSGDAVYTQEALDQIISQLMEQHPTSNAPGPAAPDAIASLPKKKLDEKMLGPEGKGECSVCMDDVHIGDEVVALPCSHWFHEVCASAWLSEHNTCPICRKGIDAEHTPPSNSRRSSQTASPTTRNEHRANRLSTSRRGLGPILGRENSNTDRNQTRLDAIRSASRYSPTEEAPSPRRWQVIGDGSPRAATASPDDDFAAPMPGSFYRQTSDMSENQRDTRRGNTSGSDRSSRDSRRSSHSGGSGSGPVSWLRDRFGSNRRTD
ncbi:related to COP1-interacting protein CIP8 [Phialocephala subalpina]|uniref:RING-type E3 ubiquitin transferase n=1 Tax=Phialocephala subalpina TaxID=576137 RepID=A0A1L7XB75_9HELO|nr:related to COP1-interacting protein CIP8 [Phialocephala subalpina]